MEVSQERGSRVGVLSLLLFDQHASRRCEAGADIQATRNRARPSQRHDMTTSHEGLTHLPTYR